jgi:hypothetical protein
VERYLSTNLCRDIHYLATIRNKLVHEYGFNAIPVRCFPAFLSLLLLLMRNGRSSSSNLSMR